MTTRPQIIGAIPTSFSEDGELDLAGLHGNLERLEPLLDGVFAAGTTGEFPALADEERLDVIEAAVTVFGADRVVAHVGAATTRQAVALTEAAIGLGARRFAAVTPYYLKASAAGVQAYFAALRATITDGELYGYFFPDVAVTDVAPLELPALVDTGLDGVKVSGSASTRVQAYLDQAPAGFKLWSGSDADLPGVLAAGGLGVVSGVSSVVPEPWAAFREAYAAGDQDGVDRAQSAIDLLVPVLGPNIAHLKYGLSLAGLAGGPTRMSVDAPTPEVQDQIASVVAQARELLG